MPPSIGYVPKGYPRVSETFVINEIRELERLGLSIEIFPLKRPVDGSPHPSALEVQAPLVYLPEKILLSLPRLLWVHARVSLRSPRRYGRTLGWTLRRCLLKRSTTTLRRFFQAGYLVGNVLRERNIPHLHAHFCHGPATVTMFVKWLTGIPFSFTAHAKDLYLTPPDLLREKMREAKFVVTCTEANRAYMQQIGGDGTVVHRIYHGTDLTLFRNRRHRVPGNPPRLLTVGRLVEKKGFPTLLRACALLRDRGIAFRCEIYGEGPQRRNLEELQRDLKLQECVRLHGEILQPDLAMAYDEADLFVLPCQILEDGDRDGLPNVLVEAMAMGLPVVSTRVSGIPELVSEGLNGFLVQPRDPVALADALERLLQDPELRHRFGQAGRSRVLESYDLKRNTRALARLFRACLEPGMLRTHPGVRRDGRTIQRATSTSTIASAVGDDGIPWSVP